MSVFFSIVMPTYNRAGLIRQTLQTLLNQTFTAFEIIVVDDGGTDNTREVVEAFADSRLHYHWKQNAERGAARNYGADLARGQYLNFFDSDDRAYANHLQTAFDYITKNPDTVALHTSYDWKDAQLQAHQRPFVHHGKLNQLVFKRNVLSCNNVFIRKQEFNELRFSEDRELSASEDWLLWLRVCCRYTLQGLPAITSTIIQHDTRSMVTANGDSTLRRAIALERNMQQDACLQKMQLTPAVMTEMYSLTALDYAIAGNKKKGIQYLKKAIALNSKVIFTRRFLAILKHLISK